MAEKEERLYAQFKLLEYLQQSKYPKTTQEILQYLQDNTTWGRLQLQKKPRGGKPSDGGLRNLQNWLENIRESKDFEKLIECTEQKPNAYNFKASEKTERRMPIEEACFVLMAERFLDSALPVTFIEGPLRELVSQAWTAIKEHENRPALDRQAARAYLKRIAMVPRGQQLMSSRVPHDVLNDIHLAILNKRCVEMHYKDEPRLIHPYAIIIRDPKIYLLGVEDKVMVKAKRKNFKPDPVPYLCNHIENAKISNRPNQVPPDFNANDFVNKGSLDIRLREDLGLSERSFTLKLRIYISDNPHDNLLRDLGEFPLSSDQVINQETGTENFVLSASGMHASHQLGEWIMGRMDRVEVLAPTKLREYVAERIAKVHQLYTAQHN